DRSSCPAINEQAAQCVAVEQKRAATPRPWPGSAAQPFGCRHGGVEEDRLWHEFVDEPQGEGLPATFVAGGKNHVQRCARTDEARQAIRSTSARNQPQLHLGKSEYGLGVIAGDAIAAGKRQFQPTAEAGTMDCSHERLGGIGDALHQQLTILRKARRFLDRSQRGELLDVGAGNEDVRLAGSDHDGLDEFVALEPLEQVLQFPACRIAHLVDGIVRRVQRHHGDTTLMLRREGTHTTRSSTTAKPMPPCAQIDISPNWTSRRTISLESVVTSRDPVAPNGCPTAIEPPITLVRFQSTSPTGPGRPRRLAQAGELHAWMFDSTCAAKAS